jgi:hypothetical protein
MDDISGRIGQLIERQRAQEALEQAEGHVRQLQRLEAVVRLAGGVAHDFNNLLTVIMGRGDILLGRLPADHPHRRDIALIKKTAERAAALTKQLLAFSRKQILEPRSFPPITTVYPILLMISFSHLLNDTIQSLIPSIYPMVKSNYHLSFSQVGLITLTFQIAASIFQPLVGLYTDHRPKPFSLVISMGFTLVGLIWMSQAAHFHILLLSVALIGVGAGVLGAVTLREFALALLVGLLTGSYSSIFIASPLLAMLKEREPRFKLFRGTHATKLELERLVLGGSPAAKREAARQRADVIDGESVLPVVKSSPQSLLTHPPRPRKKKRRTS